MSTLWVGAAAVICAVIVVRMPTLRHAHALIVKLRAAVLLAREMWEGAMLRRARWSECMDRAARDV